MRYGCSHMRHHQHAGIVGRLSADRTSLIPHPDAFGSPECVQVWVPLPDAAGREVDALEIVTCRHTRAGAARVVAVPHVAVDLAMGDELAISDFDGVPLARGTLASSLEGTVRIVAPTGGASWRELAGIVDDIIAGTIGDGAHGWFDMIGDTSIAASVPRAALGALFDELAQREQRAELRWEYATAARHA